MKKNVFLFIVIIVLGSCSKKQDNKSLSDQIIEYHDNGRIKWVVNKNNIGLNKSRISFYENGNIKDNSFWKNDIQAGVTLDYFKDGSLEKVGFVYGNKPFNYLNIYKANHLMHSRQYIWIKDTVQVNQFFNYDQFGNINKNSSCFALISLNKDTMKINENNFIQFDLVAPYFNDGKMEVVIRNYDELFNLKSNELNVIENNSFSCKYNFTYQKSGENYIRGFIRNFKTQTINNDNSEIEYRIYFSKKIVVIS